MICHRCARIHCYVESFFWISLYLIDDAIAKLFVTYTVRKAIQIFAIYHEMQRKTRYYLKYSAQYHVFPATFHVKSRKIDFLWDSVLLLLKMSQSFSTRAYLRVTLVGWSDLALLTIFENGHYAANQVKFYESTRCKVFILKNHRGLK